MNTFNYLHFHAHEYPSIKRGKHPQPLAVLAWAVSVGEHVLGGRPLIFNGGGVSAQAKDRVGMSPNSKAV